MHIYEGLILDLNNGSMMIDFKTVMHQRDNLHSQALKTNSDYHWTLYKRERIIVRSKIKEAKRTYVDEVMEQVSRKPKDM